MEVPGDSKGTVAEGALGHPIGYHPLWIMHSQRLGVLLAILQEPGISCMAISSQHDIPISAVYRAIRELIERGMVHISGKRWVSSKPVRVYEADVKGLNIAFEQRGVNCTLMWRDGRTSSTGWVKPYEAVR